MTPASSLQRKILRYFTKYRKTVGLVRCDPHSIKRFGGPFIDRSSWRRREYAGRPSATRNAAYASSDMLDAAFRLPDRGADPLGMRGSSTKLLYREGTRIVVLSQNETHGLLP